MASAVYFSSSSGKTPHVGRAFGGVPRSQPNQDRIANNTSKPAIQQYPTYTHLGKAATPASGPIALDARLTDDDVIALLQTAYPETELEEIQGNEKIMKQYFTCVHHDRDVIRSHITGEPLLYNQEMESAGEREEDDDSTGEDGEEDSGVEDADDSGSDDNEEEAEDYSICNATDPPNLPTLTQTIDTFPKQDGLHSTILP